LESGKVVCDILALRVDHGRSTPVLVEPKDNRMHPRLVEQVEGYAKLIDEHAASFGELYGAMLGRGVAFDGPTEEWIVWPHAGEHVDPHEAELRERGVRVVGYVEDGTGAYRFRVASVG